MKGDISRIREVSEESLGRLSEIEDSLSAVESSLDESIRTSSSIISEKISRIQRELELQKKGQRGFCQKHGYTILIWERGEGWRCAECILE